MPKPDRFRSQNRRIEQALGLPRGKIAERLRNGWCVHHARTMPRGKRKPSGCAHCRDSSAPKAIEQAQEARKLNATVAARHAAAEKALGLTQGTVQKRIAAGWCTRCAYNAGKSTRRASICDPFACKALDRGAGVDPDCKLRKPSHSSMFGLGQIDREGQFYQNGAKVVFVNGVHEVLAPDQSGRFQEIDGASGPEFDWIATTQFNVPDDE